MADFLNLDDHEYFRAWNELPEEADYTGEALEYCFLAEIQHCDGFGRYRCIVKDREGSECIVAFYPSNSTTFFPESNEDGFEFKKLKKGHTLAIIGALQRLFLDGTTGVRVEDMKLVSVSTVDQVEGYRGVRTEKLTSDKVVPASLQALQELGPEEEEYSVAGLDAQWKCHGCDASKPIAQMSRCGRCKTYAYCSKECQEKGWTVRNHKTACKVLRARHELKAFTSEPL